MTRRDPNYNNDNDYGIEAYFHEPKTDYIDLTIELRDILTNRVQPIMAITNGKCLPPFKFIFDIN